MAVHKILKMGDPRLFRVVRPVTEFGTDTLEHLIADMYDTMRAARAQVWRHRRSVWIFRWWFWIR